MKIISAVVALLCVVVIDAEENDKEFDDCIAKTGADRSAFEEFMKGTKDDCIGLEAFMKCVVEAKGYVKDGVVINLSELEGLLNNNERALKQLNKCKSISGKEICKLGKCIRSAFHLMDGEEEQQNKEKQKS